MPTSTWKLIGLLIAALIIATCTGGCGDLAGDYEEGCSESPKCQERT